MKEHPFEATLRGRIPPMALDRATHHRIVVERPRVRRPAYAPLRSAPGSGLLVPAPWTDDVHPISYVLAGIHAARTAEDALLLVVGHATVSEVPALAAARSEAIRCLLHADADAWVALATAHGSIRDVKAYLQYLNAMLGWSCHVDIVDQTTGPATAKAVEAFQAEYVATFAREIDVDGVCGTETLGALFEVMRFEWDKWLHKHGLAQADVDALDVRFLDAAGLPASLPALAELEGEPGVDLLVVPRAALGGEEPTAELVYGSTVVRFETFEIPIEPWAWQQGPYTLVTDLVPGEPVAKEVYALRSMDGEFEAELTLPDDAIDRGVLELEFVAVPCDKRYELRVSVHDEGTWVLFSDVPYNELHRLATEGSHEEPKP
jgi:hypothetical protein